MELLRAEAAGNPERPEPATTTQEPELALRSGRTRRRRGGSLMTHGERPHAHGETTRKSHAGDGGREERLAGGAACARGGAVQGDRAGPRLGAARKPRAGDGGGAPLLGGRTAHEVGGRTMASGAEKNRARTLVL